MKHVKELSRVSRTERFLDIGSMATLEQVLTVGHHILPPVLAKALRAVGPSTITSEATIGGNLCIPDLRLNLASVFSLFNVQAELRGDQSQRNHTRWVPLFRFYDKEGTVLLRETEILTRVRIPFEEGNYQLFQQIGFPYQHPEEAVLFSVFANFSGKSVTEYRVSICFPKIGIFRSRDMETSVTNQDLPLQQHEIQQASQLLKRALLGYSSRISSIQHARAVRSFERSLILLNTKSVVR